MASDRPWWKRAFVWEIPFLASVAAFMFWVRMIPYQARLDPELGRVYFAGSTDPFYHFRAMIGIVRNFPEIPRWDPWTFYPNGTATGQFGTLFDWLPSAWVVLTKGRDASEYDIAIALSVYTAIIGAIIAVPFYYLAKRMLGAIPAIAATLALALMPGGFLAWGLATAGDHHGAEALMSVVGILGVLFAAERAHALRANIRRDATTRELMPVALAGIVGGVALAANMLMWPPALLFGAILTAWLTVCILLENAKEDGDARGLAVGGAISMAVAGVLMIPPMDSTFLGEFNTYGLLHVVALLFAAAWILGVHYASTFERRHGWNPWTVPGIVAGGALVVFLGVNVFFKQAAAGLAWGLSWITGVGTARTTATIGEAQKTAFFCTQRAIEDGQNCLNDDFGVLPAITFFILIAVIVVAIVRRNRADILLAIWAFVIFRATDTQARFGYYLAVVMALLVGWLAARMAEIGRVFEAPAPAVKRTKGTRRDTKTARRAERPTPLALQAGAAFVALLFVVPGNVFATDKSFPSWRIAEAYAGRSGDMVVWLDGLDWMRQNTPDAGLDLARIYERPAPGEQFQYPENSYGVLSWWDYGHWIQTWGKRPPVANPFQQAAPFASLWFTERDPARAEAMLTEWERGQPPIRYVWIDDEMDTTKYGAISRWANTNNDSRPEWPTQPYLDEITIQHRGSPTRAFRASEIFDESMMSRLFERDGEGLSNYRLVYEHYAFTVSGTVLDEGGNIREGCFHTLVPGPSCSARASIAQAQDWQDAPQSTYQLGENAYGYDLKLHSRLKLFERVAGAQLTGTAEPGAEVVATVVLQSSGLEFERPFRFTTSARAGDDGAYTITWPYPTAEFLSPAEGGTNASVKPQSKVLVRWANGAHEVDVTERAVLDGSVVPVG